MSENEIARGDIYTPFVAIHPNRRAITHQATGAGTQPEEIQCLPFNAPPVLVDGDLDNTSGLPPIQWVKRDKGTVCEIMPILAHDSGVSGKQFKFRVFIAARDGSGKWPGNTVDDNTVAPSYTMRHVCNGVATAGAAVSEGTSKNYFNRYLEDFTTWAEIGYAATITINDDKALPPGVKVVGDYGNGPAAAVFDAGGADWVGVAITRCDSSGATTNACEAATVAIRFR